MAQFLRKTHRDAGEKTARIRSRDFAVCGFKPVIFLLLLHAPVMCATEQFVLNAVTVSQDSMPVPSVIVALTFDNQPISFPIYAMAGPDRIVIDLPDTKAEAQVRSFEPEVDFVEAIEVTRRTIGSTPNVRIEIFLKHDARYSAVLNGNDMILTLKEAQKIHKTISVFSTDSTNESLCSLNGIEARALEKSFEVDLSFTQLPQAASIYMLESPPRIVMDFNNVFVDTQSVKDVNVAPVKNVSVIKRDGQLPYAGVVVNLEKKVTFYYEQIENRIVLTIPSQGAKLSKRGKIMIIGAGALVAGGFVTGILLSGDEEGEGAGAQSGEDLGAPPEFPQF